MFTFVRCKVLLLFPLLLSLCPDLHLCLRFGLFLLEKLNSVIFRFDLQHFLKFGVRIYVVIFNVL